MRANAHRSKTNLHVRQNLALQPVHRDHGDRESAEDEQDVDEGPKNVPGLSGSLIALEIREDVIEHYRSTSPSTISSVPMRAPTSATSAPRTKRSRACKLTNEGGRTRRR